VAAVVASVYVGLGGRAVLRRTRRRRAVVARRDALDGLVALAADLRAGLVAAGSGPVGSTGVGGRLGQLTTAAWRLAERTGAPVADLVERIEADARAADRAAASAAAQAAGAQATALLLAALPLGGIALGVAIGADPVHVLLHTPIGAVCAIAAVLLQGGGLLWSDRLAAGVAR
jgi:tight adherence protein B